MAEVTGEIGGQPVLLENAATEATLRQLVNAIAVLSSRMNKDGKKGSQNQKKVEEQLEKFFRDLKKVENQNKKTTETTVTQQRVLRANNQAVEENTKSKKDNTRYTYMAGAGLRLLGQTTKGVVLGMNGVLRDLSTMGDSLSSASGIFSRIPIIGDVLSGVFGAAAAAAESIYKSFTTAASVGANFSGNMSEMINSATKAGLTFDQFASVVARNGESLALLGRGTADGAKRLADLSLNIRRGNLANSLYRLGYTTEDINNGIAQFGGRLARTGVTQIMTTEKIAKVTGEYLQELDAVAKLTGKSKESLQQQADARMRDAQFTTYQMKLNADGQKRLELLMSTIPEGMQEGAKEVLATGTATTDAGRRFLAFMNQSGVALSDLNRISRQTGTITEQQMVSVANVMQREGKALANSQVGETAGLFVKELNDIILGAQQYNARTENIGKLIEENRKNLSATVKASKMDPANMAVFKQQIAAISNEFAKFLASSELLEQMMRMLEKYVLPFIRNGIVPAFQMIPEILENYVIPIFDALYYTIKEFVIPGFKLLYDNLDTVIPVIGALAAAYIGLKGAMAAYQAKLVLKEMAVGRLGSTPANPMWVKNVDGVRPGSTGTGGGADTDRDKKDDKDKEKSKGKDRPGRIRMGLGAVTAVVSAAELASEISDINKREAAGEITGQEASKEKTVATGAAVGTTGGAMGGMYGGAALGTMVAGPLGTVVGGLIGGAIGAWLGRKGGETIAESISSATTDTVGKTLTEDKPDLVAAKSLDAKLAKISRADILAHPAYKRIFEEEVARNQENIKLGRKTQVEVQREANRVAIEQARKEIEAEFAQTAAQTVQPTAPVTGSQTRPDQSATETRRLAATKQTAAQPRTATPPLPSQTTARQELIAAQEERKKAEELAKMSANQTGADLTRETARSRSMMSPQEKLESSVAALNTNIDTLIGLSIRTNMILSDQLNVQKTFQGRLSGNLLR
jgi:hypothetical protein